MIVRILEDGQYEVPENAVETLEKLDLELERAIRDGNEVSFTATLAALVNEVHGSAERLAPEVIVPSNLTIPAIGSSLEEVRRLLESEPAQPSTSEQP